MQQIYKLDWFRINLILKWCQASISQNIYYIDLVTLKPIFSNFPKKSGYDKNLKRRKGIESDKNFLTN